MNFIKHLATNLGRPGVAVLMIVWLGCFTALVLYAPANSNYATGFVGIIGVVILTVLGNYSPPRS